MINIRRRILATMTALINGATRELPLSLWNPQKTTFFGKSTWCISGKNFDIRYIRGGLSAHSSFFPLNSRTIAFSWVGNLLLGCVTAWLLPTSAVLVGHAYPSPDPVAYSVYISERFVFQCEPIVNRGGNWSGKPMTHKLLMDRSESVGVK